MIEGKEASQHISETGISEFLSFLFENHAKIILFIYLSIKILLINHC